MMKFLITLFAIVLVTKECDNKKTAQTNLNANFQNNTTITYQAISRGWFEEISVTKDSIYICNDRNRKEITSMACTDDNWEETLSLLGKINIETLPEIKAPTSMRQYDGAAHAMLIVKDDTKDIQSNTFDHGHPPTEIKALVEKLLSFKKIAPKK